MNPKLLLLALCAVSVFSGRVLAEGQDVNIAVVDMAHLFENYAMTKDLEVMFDERRQAAAAAAESKKAAIEAKRKDLVARKPESKEFAQIEQDISRMEIEFQVWATHQEKSLKDEHKRWFLNIYKNVQNVVAQVAKESSVDLVLTYRKMDEDAGDSLALREQLLLKNVLYFDDRIELTQLVLERLNEQYDKDGGASSLRVGLAAPSNAPVTATTQLPQRSNRYLACSREDRANPFVVHDHRGC